LKEYQKVLFESASIDGCSPIGIFFRIVLPLSKAALAAIGLMFAVLIGMIIQTYKIYIVNSDLFNFQMKLRSIILEVIYQLQQVVQQKIL
jgi:putative aldouronate transport system permease protein